MFGPVASRRLSLSLGVDLVPYKICSMDCLYCEVGRTTLKTLVRKEYVPFDDVKVELLEVFSGGVRVDYITFSGYGEPTLYSRLSEVVHFVKSRFGCPVALLTNSTFLVDILDDIKEIDVILPSLDTVFQETFLKLNRPAAGLSINRIIDGIRKIIATGRHKVWLETLFVKGINDSDVEINGLREVLSFLSPDEWHVNTVVRPSAYGVTGLSYDELVRIADRVGFEKTKILSERGNATSSFPNYKAVQDMVYKLVVRRPCSFEEVRNCLGLSDSELKDIVTVLEGQGKVELVEHGGKRFIKGLR